VTLNAFVVLVVAELDVVLAGLVVKVFLLVFQLDVVILLHECVFVLVLSNQY